MNAEITGHVRCRAHIIPPCAGRIGQKNRITLPGVTGLGDCLHPPQVGQTVKPRKIRSPGAGQIKRFPAMLDRCGLPDVFEFDGRSGRSVYQQVDFGAHRGAIDLNVTGHLKTDLEACLMDFKRELMLAIRLGVKNRTSAGNSRHEFVDLMGSHGWKRLRWGIAPWRRSVISLISGPLPLDRVTAHPSGQTGRQSFQSHEFRKGPFVPDILVFAGG